MPLNSGSAIQKADADFRVSVIIPLYNHEKYIEAAIESVFSQTLHPAEIIVIDDGSVDGSAGKVRRLCKDHPEIIFWSWPNQGAHHTLNAAIFRATGDFVAILNSDDCYHPERLAACLAIVQSDPSVDVVVTGMSFFDGLGNDVENPWYEDALTFYKQERILSLGLFHANFIVTTSNLFIRRSVFEWIGYFSPLRYTHDLEFCLRIILGKRHIHFVDRPLLFYRLHEANTIAEDKARVDFERAAVFAFFLHRQGLAAETDEARRSWLERYVEVLGQQDLLEMVENLLTILDGSHHRKDGVVADSLPAEFLALLSRLGADWVAHHTGDPLLDQFVSARNAYLQRKEIAGGDPKLVSKLKTNIQWMTEQRDAWKKAAEIQDEHCKALNQELEQMRIGISWLTEQRDAWKKTAETQEEHCKALNQELDQMRIGISWLTEQRDAWMKAAEIQDEHCKALSQELEQMRIDNSLLPEQCDVWKKEAETQEEHCKALSQELEQMRTGNSWLTEQCDAWKKEAEIQGEHWKALSLELEQMRIGNSWLTEQCDAWEREAKTSGTEIVHLSAEIAKCHASLQELQRSRIFRLLILAKLLKIEYIPSSSTTA